MLFLNSVPSAVFAQTDTTVSDQRAVELRGTVTSERAWWDLQRYDLKIEVDPEARTIEGTNEITFIPVSNISLHSFYRGDILSDILIGPVDSMSRLDIDMLDILTQKRHWTPIM